MTISKRKKAEMVNRYFVDERGGCVAVRDRTLTDPENPGLHPDTTGVIKFWAGTFHKRECKECKVVRSQGWTVNQKDVGAAHALCAELNIADEGQHG